MGLEDIPVVAMPAGRSGQARAVLEEVRHLLERLLQTGEAAAIDLAGLPLAPVEREWLKERLGRGEVEIRLTAAGLSTFTETACPGVWWVCHHNEAGTMVSELIEVAHIPELLPPHPEDMKMGLERLNNLIHDLN